MPGEGGQHRDESRKWPTDLPVTRTQSNGNIGQEQSCAIVKILHAFSATGLSTPSRGKNLTFCRSEQRSSGSFCRRRLRDGGQLPISSGLNNRLSALLALWVILPTIRA